MTLALPEQRLLVRRDQVVGLARLTARIAQPRVGAHLPEPELREQTVCGREQLGEPIGVLLFAGCTRVVSVQLALGHRRTFHEGDALPLHGVGDDHLGQVLHIVQCAERFLERSDVVAIAADDVPPERAELRLDVPEIADVAHPGVGLNLVVIDDGDDLAQASIRGRRQRLPELPFLQLAVAGEHKDAAFGAGKAVGQHHALRLRDAHPQ